jgi:hypothetical protein
MVLIPINRFEGKPRQYTDPLPSYRTHSSRTYRSDSTYRNHTRRRIRKHTRHSTITYRDRIVELWPPTLLRGLLTLQYEFLILELVEVMS